MSIQINPLLLSQYFVIIDSVAGGAVRRLRLVVRGAEGTRARLVVGSLRAGSAALDFELR